MLDALKDLVLRFLRVPPQPAPPEGGRVIRVFRAAPNYFAMKMVMWGMRQAAALIGLVVGTLLIARLVTEITNPTGRLLLVAGETIAWAIFLVQIPFSLAVMRLDYEMRWYILSDRSLRIREGVLRVREKTLTFANIQQISIRQGPLQRLLGLADVQVTTAGGGSGGGKHGEGSVGESMHEAYFRGVDNAEEIRGAIKERVRLHRDAGLGDPDEPAALSPPDTAPDALEAALELRDEMRRLRAALAPR